MNLLTSLNLSGCGKLTALFTRNNLLPSLELSDCSSLEYVELVDNRLTHIDLSTCPTCTSSTSPTTGSPPWT